MGGTTLGLLLLACLLPRLSGENGLPRPDHVVMVIEENKPFDWIIGSSNAPYINQLAQRGALFTSSYAIRHPSQPNYLALFSGFGYVSDDSCPHTFNGTNLASELFGAGLSFAGYSESMPAAGFKGCDAGGYARKHNPWVNFVNVPAWANLPFSSFPTDYSQLPTVSIVVPNLANDMHDGPIARGDRWLQDHLSGYIEWAQTHQSLFILTWDEGKKGTDNRIVTIFLGPMVRPGEYCERINHFNVLRTLLDFYDLPAIGRSAGVDPISSVWIQDATSPPIAVELVSPSAGSVFPGPADLSLSARAVASQGVISRVEFYEHGTRLGEAVAEPFDLTLNQLPPGDYCFTAIATDALGRRQSSTSVGVQVVNLFPAVQGRYQGLIYNTNNASADSSGAISLALDAQGAFSARLQLGLRSYRLAGRFGGAGTAVARAAQTGRSNGVSRFLEATLTVDLAGGSDQLWGTLRFVDLDSAGVLLREEQVATILSDRLVFDRHSNPAPDAGTYTLIFPGEGDGLASPGGHGFAAVKVGAAGSILLTGLLADGSTLRLSSSLAKDGRWPLYAPWRRGAGMLLGWLWFTRGPTNSELAGGCLDWIRPGLSSAKDYPMGFTNRTCAAGSSYHAPEGESRVLNLTNGVAVLAGGELSTPSTNTFRLEVDGRVFNMGSNPFTLTFTKRTGLWQGRVFVPEPAEFIRVQGAVLQSSGVGLGFFLGNSGSGRVSLQGF